MSNWPTIPCTRGRQDRRGDRRGDRRRGTGAVAAHAAPNRPEAGLAIPWRYSARVPDDELRAAYSEEFIERIARKFNVPNEFRQDLRETALRSGAFYKQRNLIADGRPTAAETRAYFELMQYHVSRLLRLLEQADDIGWRLFNKFEEEIQEESVFLRSSTAMQDIGALELVDPENDTWEMYTTKDLPPLLKLIGLISERAERELPTPPRRTKGQIALLRWVRSLCDFWQDHLGRAVRFDQANPGSSATLRFLEALLEPLDASVIRYLPSVLREKRTRRRSAN